MSYAGDVTPAEAYAAVTGGEDAVLVDVRTRAEWTFVGVPDLSAPGGALVLAEWSTYPDGNVNERFVDEIREAGLVPGRPVYLLCRSGVRSRSAAEALTAAGRGQITTEIAPLRAFYYAEDYHQQYLDKNPFGYCPVHATGVTCN